MAITLVEKARETSKEQGPAQYTRVIQELPEEREFRLKVIGSAIANMPAHILVNEANGSYYVRDNSLMTVWADDLTKGCGSELIHDLARLFELEEHVDFRRTFDSEARRLAYSMDAPLTGAFSLHYSEQFKRAKPVVVSLSLGKGSLGKVYELRITPMNFGINML